MIDEDENETNRRRGVGGHGLPGAATSVAVVGTRTQAAGQIKLWDAQTQKERATLQAKSMITVAYSLDGKTLASGSLDKTIKLWDLPADKQSDK